MLYKLETPQAEQSKEDHTPHQEYEHQHTGQQSDNPCRAAKRNNRPARRGLRTEKRIKDDSNEEGDNAPGKRYKRNAEYDG